jgi:hypothetical protein
MRKEWKMPRFDLSQYSTVAERIDKFWERWPEGRIHVKMVHFSPEQVVMEASIFTRFDDELPATVDYAEERPDTSPVNRVSFVENCATSAIGRALADLGGEFTGSKRPSREEMAKVQRHENRDWLADAETVKDVDALRLLWGQAKQAGASKAILSKLEARADELGSGGGGSA